uniref:Uncharacterized protein n=1 Tax=Rhizophora mucronata TaxID=61149 RepID=A0A2P2QBF5_RHIMU
MGPVVKLLDSFRRLLTFHSCRVCCFVSNLH